MDKDRFERGMQKRKDVLGDEYVNKSLNNASGFNKEFQELVTEYAWGDETLDKKTRSMMNISMLAALNRMTEWELHLKGAIRNGVTKEEVKSISHQIAVYCGIPVGVECFRIAGKLYQDFSIFSKYSKIVFI